MIATPTRRKFTIQEFQKIVETGILNDNRFELIQGEIIEMGKIGPRHAAFVRRLARLLNRQLDETQALLDVQNPIAIRPDSQPQPDLSLLRPREDDYEAGHPTPEDVMLLIEVADTTLESDRNIKVPLYAQAGITEVWLVDLKGQSLTSYQQPSARGFRLLQMYTAADMLAPHSLPELTLAMNALFPQADDV